jgi:hypothetical protein
MRYFSRPIGIERLSLEARLLYSAFCLFMLIGGGTSVWFYADDQLGTAPSDAVRYYLGDSAVEGGAEKADADDGPALDMPDLPDMPGLEGAAAAASGAPAGEGMRFEKPARQVMETFHFHLFTVPICLLIIGHLFMMCALSLRLKAGTIVLASAATLLHLLAPPLVRFASPGFAFLVFPSALLMGLSWAFMTLWPLWEMWRPGPVSE